MSDVDEPTAEQLRSLGAILHRYLSGDAYCAWGGYGSTSRLTLDGKVEISQEESALLDSLGYQDFWGNHG